MGELMGASFRLSAATVMVILLVLLKAVHAAAGIADLTALDNPLPNGSRRGRLKSRPIAAPRVMPYPGKILLLGDSLGASLEDALTTAFAALQIEFEYAGFAGTGPLTDQGEFWQSELDSKLAEFVPDVVIFQASGNYNIGEGDPYLTEEGNVVEHCTAEFFSMWQHEVLHLVARAEHHAATTMLVTAPVVADHADSHNHVNEHNAGYANIARKTGAVLVDWNELLAPDGEFQSTLTVDGFAIPLRSPDGLHFAPPALPYIADWLVREVLGGPPLVSTALY
jgi:hypothetical protein